MGSRGRDSLDRSASSESRLTYTEFLQRFPDSDACLAWLVKERWPDGIVCGSARCQGAVRKHHKVTGRQAYECDVCRHQVYPTKGTIFQKSSTSLQLWFYAIFLMASTRCGISAKQLERELGVTYPTAWRMFREIRSLLSEPDLRLAGDVEMDETYMTPMRRLKDVREAAARGDVQKNRRNTARERAVMGAVERGGRVVLRHVGTPTKMEADSMLGFVLPASVIFTDEARIYEDVAKKGYPHYRIKHSAHVYVDGDVHTQTIEGVWSLVKRGISGVYHSVSAKHLQSYLDEYAFRYSHRDDARSMFDAMLDRLAAGRTPAPSPS
jgi:transposase